MNLPFTVDQFLGIFRQYNEAIWPAQILLNFFALTSVVLALRKNLFSDKIISYILALFWLWAGLIYHISFFSTINPAANFFGGVFVLQGAVLYWVGGIKNRIAYRARFDLRGTLGAVLIIYALLIYPLLGYLFGHRYPQSPTFGAPCPTTIFTFGIFLWTTDKFPRYLLIIPALWSLLGFTAALSLGVKEDIGLLVAGIVATTLLLLPNRPVIMSREHETAASKKYLTR